MRYRMSRILRHLVTADTRDLRSHRLPNRMRSTGITNIFVFLFRVLTCDRNTAKQHADVKHINQLLDCVPSDDFFDKALAAKFLVYRLQWAPTRFYTTCKR